MLVTLALVLTGAAPAHAVGVAATRTPRDITYWGPGDPRTTREIVHALHLQSGETPESFLITATFLGKLTLVGPGSLQMRGAGSAVSSPRRVPAGRDACPSVTSAPAGYGLYRLELPAGASSTLTYTQTLHLDRAPRDPSPFVASWSVAPQPDPGVDPGPVRRLTEDIPRVLGLLGSALTLRAGRTGSGLAIGDRESLTVRPRTDMTLSGTLSYARRGETVAVWGFSPGARSPTRIGTARTDRHGRFLLRHWRPRSAGLWELYATYAGRRGSVEGTRSPCSGPRVTIDRIPARFVSRSPRSRRR